MRAKIGRTVHESALFDDGGNAIRGVSSLSVTIDANGTKLSSATVTLGMIRCDAEVGEVVWSMLNPVDGKPVEVAALLLKDGRRVILTAKGPQIVEP